MGKIKITKQEIEKLYKEGNTLKMISELAKCRIENIRSHLIRLGIKMRPQHIVQRKYNINLSYFNIINSEKKAYILGFLYADGYNQETKNQVRLTLHEQDIDILYKIKEELSYNDKPLFKIEKNNSIYYDLSINSLEISKDLAKLGCVQKKTFKLTFPDFLDKELEKHFIRGYFDGDGSISIGKETQISVTGTLSLISSIQKKFETDLNVNHVKLHKRHKETEIYTLLYHNKESIRKILEFMYKNSNIYLDRKYNKYISILEQ